MKTDLVRALVREMLEELHTCETCNDEGCDACNVDESQVDPRYAARTIPAPPPESEDDLKAAAMQRLSKSRSKLYRHAPAPDETPTIRPPKM